MKRDAIVKHRMTRWTGLVATICLAVAMIASYWFWPSLFWSRNQSTVSWTIGVDAGGVNVTRNGDDLRLQYGVNERWHIKTRLDAPQVTTGIMVQTVNGPVRAPPTTKPFLWLPAYQEIGAGPGGSRRVFVPFWMPLALCAVPTGILFYRERKPKPGCCARCRYDLTGLSSDTCPECGSNTAKSA